MLCIRRLVASHEIIIIDLFFWYGHILTAQFGSWNYGPQHGFARIIRWHVEKPPERLPSGDIEAIFCIVDNEITRSTWNYQYDNNRPIIEN